MANIRMRDTQTTCRVLALLVLTTLVLMDRSALVSAQDIFYDTTIRRLGTAVRLYCNNVTIEKYQHPNNSVPMAWMLPDLRVLYESTQDGKYRLENNNYTLAISEVKKEDLGLYHCMLLTEDDSWFLVRLGLNARGPFYKTVWEEYRMNTIIGTSVAGGWLVLVALIYATSKLPCLSCFFNAFNNGGADDDDYDSSGKKHGLYNVGRYRNTSEFSHNNVSVEMSEKKYPHGSHNTGFENGESSAHI